jgi:hypothetical protein
MLLITLVGSGVLEAGSALPELVGKEMACVVSELLKRCRRADKAFDVSSPDFFALPVSSLDIKFPLLLLPVGLSFALMLIFKQTCSNY